MNVSVAALLNIFFPVSRLSTDAPAEPIMFIQIGESVPANICLMKNNLNKHNAELQRADHGVFSTRGNIFAHDA